MVRILNSSCYGVTSLHLSSLPTGKLTIFLTVKSGNEILHIQGDVPQAATHFYRRTWRERLRQDLWRKYDVSCQREFVFISPNGGQFDATYWVDKDEL